MTISELQAQLRSFAAEREWEQFHNPKNLVMALTGEVGELSEIFQWLPTEQAESVMTDPRRASRVHEELADVFGYLIRLADVLGVDLEAALTEKIGENARKYPVDKARGSAAKYTEFDESL